MRAIAFSIIGLLAVGTSLAQAHEGEPHDGGYPGGSYGSYPGRVPSYGYYGNGGHDAAPHWHETTTPFGRFSWYGTGRHDFQPHEHRVTPYRYESDSDGPFWRTRSFHSPRPSRYLPW
jgi:hypothetical protein